MTPIPPLFPLQRRALLRAGTALLFTAGGVAVAQGAYPDKQVRVVVGFSPGGPTDIVARAVARYLGEDMKQSFFVDNKPGAAGNLATIDAIRAAPNGYTILVSGVNITINPAITPDIGFDGGKQLQAVRAVASAPTVLVVRKDFPAHTPQEFLAEVRRQPNKYSSGAPGSSPLLAIEMFTQLTGTEIVPIPYKGAAPGLVDLMGGHVDMSFATLGSVLPQIRSGKIRAIAMASARRSPMLPDVPTFVEAGLPNFTVEGWTGVFVPTGTPPEIVHRLAASLDRMVQSSEVAAQLREAGLSPVAVSSPEQFQAEVMAELSLYEGLGKSLRSRTLAEPR